MTMDPAGSPLVRAFASAPHVMADANVAVWFTDPPGMVIQTAIPQCTLYASTCQRITHEIWDQLYARVGQVRHGYYFVHDYTRVGLLEPGCRSAFTAWALRIRPNVRTIFMVQSPNTPLIIRMGQSVALTAIAIAGIKISMVTSLAETVQKLGLQPLSP